MKKVTAVLLVLLTALAVFAACSKNSVHTVTFDSSGGTQIKTQHIRDGESAKKPWDPHKEGFTFIEVVASCPTNWGLTPVKAMEFVREKMIPYYPLGVYKDKEAK